MNRIDAELIMRVRQAGLKAALDVPAIEDTEAAKFVAMYRAIRAYDLGVAMEELKKHEEGMKELRRYEQKVNDELHRRKGT